MTDTNDKLRALFLAALMVVSVFGGAIAFTGGAAAASSPALSADDSTTSASTTHTGSLTIDSGDAVIGQNYASVEVDYDTNTDADLSSVESGDVSVTVERADGSTVDVPVDSIETSTNPLTITSDNSVAIEAGDIVTVTVDNVVNPTTTGAYSVDVSVTDDGTPETVSGTATLDITTTISGTVTDDAGDAVEGATVQAVPGTGSTLTATTDANGDYTIEGAVDTTYDVSVADGTYLSVTTSSVDTSTNSEVTDEDFTVYEAQAHVADSTFWQGQELLVTGLSADTTYQVRNWDSDANSGAGGPGSLVSEFTTDSDANAVIQTGTLDGEYTITQTDGSTIVAPGGDETFEIAVQSMDVEFADDSVDNMGSSSNVETDLEVDSNRGDFDVAVSAELDGDAVSSSDLTDAFENAGTTVISEDSDDDEVVVNAGSSAALAMNFSGLDAGDYEFTVDATDTSAEDTASITVNDIGEGEMDLEQTSIEQQQGDIAEINVTFEDAASTGYLVIGDEDDVGYQANVSIDSGGEDEVTIAFNTYAAGQGAAIDDVVWVADDDSDASVVTGESNENTDSFTTVLDEGDYQLSVMAGASDGDDALENADNVGTLWIQERSLNGVTTWTAPDGDASDLDDVESITEAVDEGTLTETDSFAKDDVIVHAIDVSGLEGVFEYTAGTDEEAATTLNTLLTATTSSDGDTAITPLDLRIRQTQESTGPNADPVEVDTSALMDDSTVILNEDADTVYIVSDESDIVDNDGNSLEDGDEFETRFRVQDDYLLDFNAEEDDWEDVRETVTTTFGVEDREAEFNVEDVDGDDYVTVNAESGQNISGSTNIAPGSEVRIRAMGTGDARFVKEQTDIVVQNDGTFSAEFDFSDRAVDEEFDVSLRGAISDVSASGLIVESTDDETTTTEETTTEETTTEETTEETTTEETTEETTTEQPTTTEETETQTPGFGIAVAMLALIGAALVALRRRS